MARLDPSNLRPAQDIIIDDLKEEETKESNWHIASGGMFSDFIVWGIFVVAVIGTTWALLKYWHILEQYAQQIY
jgi:hypothetical protein